MGARDTKSKEYLSANDRFADIFNYYLFDGESVIEPESLTELDSVEAMSIYGLDFKAQYVQKWRDLLKHCVVKTTPEMTLVILGVENQSEIHYAMPVKNIIYDALTYGKQVAETARKHAEAAKQGQRPYKDHAEFLSGFTKEDRLIPVITLTVYWGTEAWDGPVDLEEMFGGNFEDIRKYINNYRVNLIEPARIEDFSKFKTEIGAVLEFIKYSDKGEEALETVLNKNPMFKNMSYESVSMIETFTGTTIKVRDEGEGVNMCKAWDDMIAKSEARGTKKEKHATVRRMFEKNRTLDDISEVTDLTIEQVQEVIASFSAVN